MLTKRNSIKINYNDEIGYIKLRIPNTRFRIVFKDIYFNILQFFRLVGVRMTQGDEYTVTDYDIEKWICSSLQYDNKDTQEVQYQTVLGYLNYNIASPQIEDIYYILSPEGQFLRETTKAVGIKKHSQYIKARHIGINSKELNEDELQALVDYFYQNSSWLPFHIGYVFYMLYERLHPNPDFNGVLGRTIFLENKHHPLHFPISIFIKDVKCRYVSDIYELFNFSQKSFTPSNSIMTSSTSSSSQDSLFTEPQDNEKYFQIKLNERDISKIILILLFSVLYYKYYRDEEAKQILIKYFQDPFEDNPEFDNTNIENFKEIREMINELDWN